MPYDELLKWGDYFRKRPIGYREDQRAYMLLRAQGVKESAENLFPTLYLLKQQEIDNQKPDRAIPKGKFLEKLLKAKSGDGSSISNLLGGTND